MNWLAHRFELSRGGNAANIRPMEGLRGFAVFLVFLTHYVTLARPWIPGKSQTMEIAGALHSMGNIGVDLFFVLSGFLIYGSLIRRKQAYYKFICRRVERIYPTFTAVFLLYVFLSLIFHSDSKIPRNPTDATLYLLQNFLLLPGLLPIEPMITVAWSLSYEMFYYLATPIAIEAFRLRERSPVSRMVFFTLVALLPAVFCNACGEHIRLIMFICGILLFEAINLGEEAPRPPSSLGALSLALGMMGTLLPLDGPTGHTTKIAILFVTFLLLCMACLRSPSGWLARSFCWTPLRWLGNMSFSYYLLHGLTLKAAFLILPALLPGTSFGPWLFWVLLPAMFSITLLPTAALFLAIERPYSLSNPRSRYKATEQFGTK